MNTRKCYETHTQCHGSECEQTKPERAQDARHTPGTWRVGEGGDGLPRIYGESPSDPICQFGDGMDETRRLLKNYKANAAFIVRACNSHATLLGALENIEASGTKDPQALRLHASAALAKAKGQK